MFSNSQRTVLSGGKPMLDWSYTVNTEASGAGEKIASIPFNLYISSSAIYHGGAAHNTGIKNFIVYWGDGTKTVLKSEDFSGPHDNSLTVHEYRNAGTYTITVSCDDWESLYFDCPTYQNTGAFLTSQITDTGLYKNYYYFQRTLIKVNDPIPNICGSRYYKDETTYGMMNGFITAVFANCTHLTSIPSGIFKNLTTIDQYYNTFTNCTSLTSVPANIFGTNDILRISSIFQGCSSLTSIPANLFANSPSLLTVSGLCAECTSITAVPQNLFINNPNITTFNGIFYKCSLSSIPAALFSANGEALEFQGSFAYNPITSIPETLFKSCTKATSFNGTFANCGQLASIPAALFRYNEEASNFQGAFANCGQLASIPAALFKYTAKASIFGSGGSSGGYGSLCGCFENTGITAVPEHLFDTNVEMLSLTSCFRNCSSLRSIPSNLLLYNVNITTLTYFLYGCSMLSSFSIRIKSPNVAAAHYFMSRDASNTTKKIYVPNNSTTFNTFTNLESNSSYYTGLIIVGE